MSYWISIILLGGSPRHLTAISASNGECKDLPDDAVSLLMQSRVVKLKSSRVGQSLEEASDSRGIRNGFVLTGMDRMGAKEPTTISQWPYVFGEGLHCGHQGAPWYTADSVGGSSLLWEDYSSSHGEPEQLFSVPTGLNLSDPKGRVISGPVKLTSSNITSEFLAMSSTLELKELHMVYITSEGDIVKPEKCQTWCIQPEIIWGKHNNAAAHCSNRSIELKMDSPVVDDVISLAGNTGSMLSFYHGPFDIISSLVSVNVSVLLSNNTFIHIPGLESGDGHRSKYIMEWLDIVGIAPGRIVGGDGIWAKHLYVPHWTLHFPNSMQYHWLQSRVWSAIGIPDISSRNRLIVIKRSARGISNHDTFMQLAHDYASSHKLQVYIHDDENLPSVREQLRAFADAKVILAPHGAGEAFTLATAPGACLIEMFKQCFIPNNFARQSTLLGLNYIAISLRSDKNESVDECNDTNAPVDVEDLQNAMQQCSNVMNM